MEKWTLKEEAENLKRRFQGVNRAAFARDYSVKGGQAYIYQHINGLRPISLEAAKAYAKGFNCSLEEISPRLAAEIASAAPYASTPDMNTGEAKAPIWPFSASLADYNRLSAGQKSGLDAVVTTFLAACLEGYRKLPAHGVAGRHRTRMAKKAEAK